MDFVLAVGQQFAERTARRLGDYFPQWSDVGVINFQSPHRRMIRLPALRDSRVAQLDGAAVLNDRQIARAGQYGSGRPTRLYAKTERCIHIRLRLDDLLSNSRS